MTSPGLGGAVRQTQIRLARRPEGEPTDDCFSVVEQDVRVGREVLPHPAAVAGEAPACEILGRKHGEKRPLRDGSGINLHELLDDAVVEGAQPLVDDARRSRRIGLAGDDGGEQRRTRLIPKREREIAVGASRAVCVGAHFHGRQQLR